MTPNKKPPGKFFLRLWLDGMRRPYSDIFTNDRPKIGRKFITDGTVAEIVEIVWTSPRDSDLQIADVKLISEKIKPT